jgi:hypothetical protein
MQLKNNRKLFFADFTFFFKNPSQQPVIFLFYEIFSGSVSEENLASCAEGISG